MIAARRLYLASFAVLLFHWVNQAFGSYGLMFDEAQYWFWAKHPAFGYFSKPPMVAWCIAASTWLFGDGNFGVKCFAPLLHFTTGWVLSRTTRQLGQDALGAAWVMFVYVTLPIVTSNSGFISTDVPLMLCWAVAMYATIRALDQPRWWLLAGVAVGAGMLSKYTMIAFGASALLALLAPSRRGQLLTPWPWLAAMLALLVFAPNIVWNAHHQFVTLAHTNDNVFSKTIEIYPADLLEFVLDQILLFGPICLSAVLLSLRRADSATAMLHAFFWPLAISGLLVSFLAGAQAHWIEPVYLAGVLIAVPWLRAHSQFWFRAAVLYNLSLLALFYAAPMVLAQLPIKHNPLDRLFIWNELGAPTAELLQGYPNIALMTDERKVAAALTYALREERGIETPLYKWNAQGRIRDHYDLLTRQAGLEGKPVLLITRSQHDARLRDEENAVPLKHLRLGRYEFHYYLIDAYHLPRAIPASDDTPE